MPQIKGYEALDLGLRPSETGIDATAQAANRVGRLYNQVAGATQEVGGQFAHNLSGALKDAGDVALRSMEHREISQGAAAYAELNDNLTQQWNDTAKRADPNDPTIAAKFREEVLEPALDNFGQSFMTEGGQKFAQARVDSLRNHMFEKTSADMSSLAADAVAVNVKQTANSLTNTAMLDPSSVPHLLESSDALVGGMVESSPNLKGAPAAKAKMQLTETMKEHIVKAGAIGAIQRSANPEAEAEKWGRQYPQYINGAELKQLGAEARSQIRAARADDANARRIDKEQEQTVSDETFRGNYMPRIYGDDPQAARAAAKEALADRRLTTKDAEHVVRLVEREQKPETEARVSSATSAQLMRAMRDPNADPQKLRDMIFDARTKDPGTPGSITKADFNDLQKNLLDLKTPEGQDRAHERKAFLDRFAPTIDPSMGDPNSMQFGHHTALGLQKMYETEKTLQKEEKRLGENWRNLYDPTSSDYFGKPANIMKYRASMQEAAAYQASLGDKNLTGPGKTITGVSVEDAKPPMEGARKAADGNWYVEKDGKYFKVKQ